MEDKWETVGSEQKEKKKSKHNAGARAVQILEVLKRVTDEDHGIGQTELMAELKKYAGGKEITKNMGTLSRALDELILQVNPLIHTGKNDDQYRIKYSGYDNKTVAEHVVYRKERFQREKLQKGTLSRDGTARGNRLSADLKKNGGQEKMPYLTDLRYVHLFNRKELNDLMYAVSFAGNLTLEEKQKLMEKIQSTAWDTFRSPLYDPEKKRLKRYDYGIYSRIDAKVEPAAERLGREDIIRRDGSTGRDDTVNNLKVIQDAINRSRKIEFCFNLYNDKGQKVPTQYCRDGRRHVLNPFYLVVYHEYFYLIGTRDGGSPSHFRVDLMSQVAIVTQDGQEVQRSQICRELPIRERWDPEKYMREHLYMFYDTPRPIRFRYQAVQGNFTMLHDWFGNHYKVRKCGNEDWVTVDVVCSPEAMVHFAMQYSDRIEVMDEEIRMKIREELKKMQERYQE